MMGPREGASEGEEHEETHFAAIEDPISGEVRTRDVSVGLQSLDEVDLREVFKRRAVVTKSVTPFHARFLQRRHEVGVHGSGARSCAGEC